MDFGPEWGQDVGALGFCTEAVFSLWSVVKKIMAFRAPWFKSNQGFWGFYFVSLAFRFRSMCKRVSVFAGLRANKLSKPESSRSVSVLKQVGAVPHLLCLFGVLFFNGFA